MPAPTKTNHLLGNGFYTPGIKQNRDAAIGGNEEVVARILDATQKAVYAEGSALQSYTVARGLEFDYLRAFLRNAVEGDNPSVAQRYFPEAISKTLAKAQLEWDELRPILYFSQDKPGVYQRLDEGHKAELITRIQREGEIAAFIWAREVRPDIFRSAQFKPQGFARSTWIETINR
jgi:hypothetical protein